jgi:hypothetical protein
MLTGLSESVTGTKPCYIPASIRVKGIEDRLAICRKGGVVRNLYLTKEGIWVSIGTPTSTITTTPNALDY